MSLLTPVLVILVVLAVAGGGWGFTRGGPYGPWYGGLGLILAVVVLLLLFGYRL